MSGRLSAAATGVIINVRIASGIAMLVTIALSSGCQPTVRVEAPREPITINLNIKLDADIRVRLEDQAKRDIDQHPEVF